MLEPTAIGNWNKEGELGSGGFGVVSLWTNHSTKEYLAIKKCNRFCASEVSQKQGERWKLEVKTMQELDHENIVQFRKLPLILENELAKYNPSGLPILSMEYCPMGNLRNALMKPQNSCGFSETEVIDILNDTSRALQYLHDKNITHRDFKPENIVLQPSASRVNGVIYKIIDLGYAKELDSSTVSFVGTLQYLAPEIFQYQHYSRSVDYWSFGITAFEVICGIRPFLPTLPPMASFEKIRNKKMDVISIQITRTGDIDFSNKLLEENWLTWCLSAKVTQWLKSVLQYKPENRGSMEEGVFDSLKTILSTKCITIFCVYTYEFYSYEITDTTPFGTLLERICNDIQLNPNDFYMVPTKTGVKNAFAIDVYDESNREAMLFIFNKHTGFKRTVRSTIPSIIKVIMADMKVELNESAARQVYAHTNYFVLKEEKYLKKLKDSICFFSDFIKNKFEIKKKYFTEIKNALKSYLSEIGFYDQIDNSFAEIYKTKNHPKLDQLQQNYKQGILELNGIIKVVNDLLTKDKNVFVEFHIIEKLANDLIDHLGFYNFDDLKLKASKLLESFYEDPKNQKTASPVTLMIITKTIKIRNELMHDESLANFLNSASNYCEELHEFITTVTDSNVKLHQVKENLRKIKIEELKIITESNSGDGTSMQNLTEIMKENDVLQNKIEDVLYNASMEIKNVLREVNIELDSMIEIKHSET